MKGTYPLSKEKQAKAFVRKLGEEGAKRIRMSYSRTAIVITWEVP